MVNTSKTASSTVNGPLLRAEELAIGYRHKGGKTVLAEGMDLQLAAREFVCLLGPNGAGKSTLIRTLAGMQPPLIGRLALGETEFEKLTPRQRARRLSVVLTERTPAGLMDAEALVALGRHPYSGWLGGLTGEDRAQVDAAVRAVGAEPLRHRPVTELSDGERQKIAIARALAQEARVMLLDEPTAYLDLPRRVELMALLRNLAHRNGIALLLSTHDLELALRFADRLWMMSGEGELVRGHPEALVLDGGFDRIFRSENLDWDAEQGSFRAHPEPCLQAYVEGAGLERIWTLRALERLGFGLATKEADAAFSIRIENGEWTIHRTDKTYQMEQIGGVIDWIREQEWAEADRAGLR